MKKDNFNIWMVRAGNGSYLIEEFIDNEIVAIGWNDLGRLQKNLTYEELKEKLTNTYSDWSKGHIAQSAGQIWRFFNEFEKGDKVITYDSNRREYYFGEIKSIYSYSEDYDFHHFRKVDWNDHPIDRDLLSVESRNSLGSVLTIFQVTSDIWHEIITNHPGYLTDEEVEELEEMNRIAQEDVKEQQLLEMKNGAINRSSEFIRDIVIKLSSEELELFVAGILRAMGYKTRMTPRTHDLGSDIFASKDGLEMTDPVIKVEVKHKSKSKEKIGAPEVRSFIGGLRTNVRGIYVSSTGFTKEANYEAERANFQITLLDMTRLIDLITEYYEDMDIETKALVPLKKIYWPV